MEKSIIIIGGGLTGLSAGCYGRMNGYNTTIFEMHTMAGGVATGWKRQGYTIDGAMNWLLGTNPNNSFYQFWEELGVAPDWKVFDHDIYMIIEDEDGNPFYVYCNADRFERYLLEFSPEDEDTIRELAQGIRTVSRLSMPAAKPSELYGYIDKIKLAGMLPMLHFLEKWSKITINDFAGRFTNQQLRTTFPLIAGGDFSMAMVLMMLGWQHAKAAAYVIGGALALVKPIEKRYLDLGGKISFKSRVVKILVENDKAVGIKLEDGSEHRADWIISAADGRTTIFDMLDGNYIDDTIRNMYDNPRLFAPLVYVALGIDRAFDDVPPSINGLSFPLATPVLVAGREEKLLNVRVYNFDPTLSPEGKNVAVVGFETDYDYWSKLRHEPERYQGEKARIADDVISGLEQRFPGITGQVEMVDVATPVTWERYTGNWRGSYEGWMAGSESFTSSIGIRKVLPGLDNFFMAGQWVNPGGGMPTAVMSGNHTIQLICNSDRKNFQTGKP